MTQKKLITKNLIGGVLRLLARLPWGTLRLLGRALSALLYRLPLREVHDIRVNLAIAFPELSKSDLDILVKQTLRETAYTFLEMPKIWLGKNDLSEHIQANGLPEKMNDLVAQGRGLILAMPHHGNWEMLSAAVAQNLPITGLYRPPRQAFLEPIMTAGRSTSRVRMVPTDRSGIKALHRALADGEVIAMLPDQVPKKAGAAGVVVPFFGHDAMTMTLIGRLAARQQSPVLLVWAQRQPDGRYRAEFFEADPTIADRDARIAASALNRALERCIRSSPTQYQWAYRRYGSLGPGYPNPYRR